MNFRGVVSATVLSLLSACASSPVPVVPASAGMPIPTAWLDVPHAARIDALSYAADGTLLFVAPKKEQPVAIRDHRLVNVAADKELTIPFLAIDSFDASAERKEVIFSAKRRDNFDIGLVSVDGSDIHWIPEDPADETDVQWAPRGNKVSYIVHSRSGDIVRTVHIPTSIQQAAPFLHARVHTLAWQAAAEKYAVAYETPEASDRVEVLRYSGDDRQLVVKPEVWLDVATEPVAGALLLRPTELHYSEKLPLVIWVTDQLYGWDDARGALEREVRVAVVITNHDPDAALWTGLAAIPWIDPERIFVVYATSSMASGTIPAAVSDSFHAKMTVAADASLPPAHYKQAGNVVTAPPAVVKSFAAGFIADQLKGTSRPNGRSR